MTRKTPIKHKVNPHTRGGITIKKYDRGTGKNAVKREKSLRTKTMSKGAYNVSFWFSDGGRETFNVGGGSLTGALRAAVPKIQRPKLPDHAQIRSKTR